MASTSASARSHDLVVGLNYGDGSVEGGNYRNLNGRPNGISEYVDNTADSVEAFVVDCWRASFNPGSPVSAYAGLQLSF
jgi:hypothetical protein